MSRRARLIRTAVVTAFVGVAVLAGMGMSYGRALATGLLLFAFSVVAGTWAGLTTDYYAPPRRALTRPRHRKARR